MLTGRNSDFRLSTSFETTPQFGTTHRPASLWSPPQPLLRVEGIQRDAIHFARAGRGVGGRPAESGQLCEVAGDFVHRRLHSVVMFHPAEACTIVAADSYRSRSEATFVPSSAWQDVARHARICKTRSVRRLLPPCSTATQIEFQPPEVKQMARRALFAVVASALVVGGCNAGIVSVPTLQTILVADEDAFGGSGGVIRVDPTTGAQTVVSSGGNFVDPVGIAVVP